MLKHVIEVILPTIISACELIGIFVVAASTVIAFVKYLHRLVTGCASKFKIELAEGLSAGLTFKMAAVILKTVQVQELEELLVLGAVILFKALISLMIHLELKAERERLEEEAVK